MAIVTLTNGETVGLREPNASDFLFIVTNADREKEPNLTYKAIARLITLWDGKEEPKINHEAIAALSRKDIRSLKQAAGIFDDNSGFNELEVDELENGELEVKLSNGEVILLRDSTGKDERLAGEFAVTKNASGKPERNDYRYILYLFSLLAGYEGRDRFKDFCHLVPFFDCLPLIKVYNDFF